MHSRTQFTQTFFILLTFGFILSSSPIFSLSEDQLVVVQAVSNSGQTFAIRKGAVDGLNLGQESLFSSRTMNFRAQAVEINRSFSVWKIKEKRGRVPFTKGDIVTYTNSLENLWSYLPTQFKNPKAQYFKKKNSWLIKGSYSYGLSETTSDAETDAVSSRLGLQLEASFAKQFMAQWEWLVGVRYDRDAATINEAGIDIITNRYLVTADILYYFDHAFYDQYRFFMGLSLGYGISNTTLDESVLTGTAMILPNIKIGFINRLSVEYSLVGELSIESISQRESFINDDVQTTQVLGTKLTIGLRF